MSSTAERYEKLANTKIKFFYHDSFDSTENRVDILSDMPDLNVYLFTQEKIHKSRSKVNPEMLPCYQSPLLNHQQEKHVFRKMNFLKYRAQQIISKMDAASPCEAAMQHAEHFLRKAQIIRNFIAECNFRLATMIMKHREAGAEGGSETVLSDAYFDVLKAVDYFNWTLGLKFSTYATWVVKKNFFRELKSKSTQKDKVGSLTDKNALTIQDKSSPDEEKNHFDRKALIKKLIGLLVRENLGTDRVRQAYVLEQYFGINGKQKKTLEKISDEIGVTKERIRQLKEKGLEWIKQKVEILGIDYDSEKPGESIF